MSDGAERREARRFAMTLPLRVLPRDDHGGQFSSQTRDVSYRGLYFLSDDEWHVGAEIDFVLTLPQTVRESREVEILCHGKILRVDQDLNGHHGVAARIDRYEFTAAAA